MTISCSKIEENESNALIKASVTIDDFLSVEILEENVYTIYGKTHKSADKEKFKIAIQNNRAYFFDDKIEKGWIELNPDRNSGLGGVLNTYITNGNYSFDNFLPQDSRNNMLMLRNNGTGFIRLFNFVVDNGEVIKTSPNKSKELPYKRVFVSNPLAKPYSFPVDYLKYEKGFILGIEEIGLNHSGDVFILKNMNDRNPRRIESGFLYDDLVGLERISFNDLGTGEFIGIVAFYDDIGKLQSTRIGLNSSHGFTGDHLKPNGLKSTIGNVSTLKTLFFDREKFVAMGESYQYCTDGNQDLNWKLCNSNNDGLVAFYPFNGDLEDKSGNNHNLTQSGSVSFTDGQDCIENSSINFNQGYLDNTEIPLNVNSEYTVSFWVKPDDIEASMSGGQYLFDFRYENRNNRAATISLYQKKLYYSIYGFGHQIGNQQFENSQWYHCVVNHDSNNKILRFYINGELDFEGWFDGDFVLEQSPIRIGARSLNAISPAFGSIDEVRFYNYSLSSSEVFEIYDSEKSNCTNPNNDLIAYYPFNGNAIDETGNGNDGYVVGATPTQDRFGDINSAYTFDGINDEIVISLTDQLKDLSTNSHSISVWIKLEGIQNRPKFIIDAALPGDPFGDQRGIRFESSNEPVFKWVTNTGSYRSFTGQTLNNDGTWYHILGTYDQGSSKGRIYVNGILMSESNSSGIGSPVEVMKFGNISAGGTGDGYFKGVIDDIMFFDKAFDESEVLELFNESL